MRSKTDLFRKVLKRNNYTLKRTSESGYSIEQSGQISWVVYMYYAFGVIMIAFGIVAVYLASLWGIVILVMSIPLYRRLSKLRIQQRENFYNKLTVDQNEIKIENNGITAIIDFDTISKINYEIELERDVSTGFVVVLTEEGEYTPILEMFADNKKYLEYDAKLIAQFIADILNGEGL